MSAPLACAGSTSLCEDAAPGMSDRDWTDLREAVGLLESVSLAARLSQLVGGRLKVVANALPSGVSDLIARAVETALRAAMATAIKSLGASAPSESASVFPHRAMIAAAGAAGGALGFAALPIELPLSTTLMLRAIAEIARAQGEDLARPEAALACMEVFAFGEKASDGALESGYFAVRAVLAQAIGEAARVMAARGAAEEGAPVVVRLVSMIGARYGAVVTQKAIAQAVPIVGAMSAAAINYAFMEHFQKAARGHFIVRRLERKYGAARVRAAYEQIRLAAAGDDAQEL